MTNMEIWDAVSKTDPKHTKKVNQRGGYTAVNANAQTMAATKQFGPIGKGWGYECDAPIFTSEGLIIIPLRFWHGTRDNWFGPVHGACELTDSRGKVDSDAPKKAETDGLTKALSRLGFSADVFLGLYDDVKYVEDLQREFAEKAPVITSDQGAEIETLCQGLNFPVSEVLKVKQIQRLDQLPAASFQGCIDWINKQAQEKKVTENA